MGKKGSGWFYSVKRAFKSSSDKKKENVGKWHHDVEEIVLVEHFRAESSPEMTNNTEEQHELAMTMATAAAAEAAIAAAQAAAKVVQLAGYRRHSNQENAAVLIQSYYRGYLARRALRALKGLVRLQALVRGHSVRRQAQMTMRCMQALVRVQARVKARRLQLAHERLLKEAEEADQQLFEGFNIRSPLKDLDMECWNPRRHESFNQAREYPYTISDSHMRRERALAYAYNYQQQNLETLQPDPLLEDALLYSNAAQYKTSNVTTPASTDDTSEKTVEMDTFTVTPPTISRLRPSQKEATEPETDPSNDYIPSYMSPTQSAKAKARPQARGQPTTKQRSLSVSMSPWNRGSPLASGCDSSSSAAYQFANSPDSSANSTIY